MSVWSTRVLPVLIEKACRSSAILEERQRWVPRARGDVLELGVGTGLNFAFYDPARVRSVVGIDPSPALLARADARVAGAPVPVTLVEAAAEALPFATARFDSVLVTYTLCSVDDPVRALAEARRVLRPQGELIFVEHGLAERPSTARWQRRITPVWKRVAGGCRLDRDVGALLQAAGFADVQLAAAYTDGLRILSYTYQGVARATP